MELTNKWRMRLKELQLVGYKVTETDVWVEVFSPDHNLAYYYNSDYHSEHISWELLQKYIKRTKHEAQ
jgi:hypothetical protein